MVYFEACCQQNKIFADDAQTDNCKRKTMMISGKMP